MAGENGKFEGISYTQFTSMNVKDNFRWKGLLFNGFDPVLVSESAALTQLPIGLDNPLQVEFGIPSDIDTDVLELALDGTLTIKKTGHYIVSLDAQAGRANNNLEALLVSRFVLNGQQVGKTNFLQINAIDLVLPFSNEFFAPLLAGDVLSVEIYRDSQGVDDGGLLSFQPTVAGFGFASTARVRVIALLKE